MDETAVTILMEGLNPSLSGFVQSALRHQKPTFTNVLQKAELVYYSVQATGRRIYAAWNCPSQDDSSRCARGLPPYPRIARREAVQVMAVEPDRYNPNMDWIARRGAAIESDTVYWDVYDSGEGVEHV